MPGRDVVAVLVGTRPEAIKMAPIVLELRRRASLTARLVSTGQHDEMLAHGLRVFDLAPDDELAVMRPDQTLTSLSARLLRAIEGSFAAVRPSMVLVQGDTATTFFAGLVGFYLRIPVGHVEAGLRTGDKRNPFPEEIYRRMTTAVADLHFAATERARTNLLAEGVSSESIHVTGNPVIDALQYVASREDPQLLREGGLDAWLDPARRLILVTAHRRESFGEGLDAICRAVRAVAVRFEDSVQVVFPVHLNPSVRRHVNAHLSDVPNVRLLPPLEYQIFVALLRRCYIVMTDSGGIQEEAPAFGKPTLVMRETTERTEAIDAGCARLVGVSEARITAEAVRLLESRHAYEAMAVAQSPFGDGRAAQRIVDVVERVVARRATSTVTDGSVVTGR
jgi:UDP-N-acetylglucosamine 2-epimerase (non-hydrolysing)